MRKSQSTPSVLVQIPNRFTTSGNVAVVPCSKSVRKCITPFGKCPTCCREECILYESLVSRSSVHALTCRTLPSGTPSARRPPSLPDSSLTSRSSSPETTTYNLNNAPKLHSHYSKYLTSVSRLSVLALRCRILPSQTPRPRRLSVTERSSRTSWSRRALALAVTTPVSRYRYRSFHMLAGQIWLSDFGCQNRCNYQCI